MLIPFFTVYRNTPLSHENQRQYYDKTGDLIDLAVIYGVYLTPQKINKFLTAYTSYQPDEIADIVSYTLSDVIKKEYSRSECSYMRKQIESGFEGIKKKSRKPICIVVAVCAVLAIISVVYFSSIPDSTFYNLNLDSTHILGAATYSVDSSWEDVDAKSSFYYYPF